MSQYTYGLDNVNMTLSSTGSILKKYEYSDYGERNLDSKTEILDNEYGYNGEAHTVDGLQYLRSRYYDPVTGVFISADSYRGVLNDLLSQNRYTYCHNNPYKYDDPSGHLPIGGINKNTVNAYMDAGGSGTSSNTTVKPPLPKPVKKPATQPQNTNYNSGTLLRDVGRTPSVKTEAVIFGDNSEVSVTAKEETKATGEQENESIGTVTTIVTESHDNTQPYGVESYETQETETKIIETKDMAKMILSGIVMAGIGILIAGAFALTSVAAPVAAIATAVITGFAGSYVNAGVGALVENQSMDEYGRSQGYQTLKEYKNKIFQDAVVGATVGSLISMLTMGLVYGTAPIENSVSNSVANQVANQSDETAVAIAQSADDFGQVSDDLIVVVDKADETVEVVEQSAKTAQQTIADDSGSKPLGIGNPVEVEGKGNTGRTIPNTLNEQMAMHQVMSNPLDNAIDMSQIDKYPIIMTDQRWPASDGWVKMSNNVNGIEIHFVYNRITGAFDDFKFK